MSASVAARAVLGAGGDGSLAGLRGVGPVTTPTDRQQLGMAAVCLGIGRAALHEALTVTRSRGDRATGEPADAPHWALADAATEMDAARLLVRSAALGPGLGAAAAFVYAGRRGLARGRRGAAHRRRRRRTSRARCSSAAAATSAPPC